MSKENWNRSLKFDLIFLREIWALILKLFFLSWTFTFITGVIIWSYWFMHCKIITEKNWCLISKPVDIYYSCFSIQISTIHSPPPFPAKKNLRKPNKQNNNTNDILKRVFCLIEVDSVLFYDIIKLFVYSTKMLFLTVNGQGQIFLYILIWIYIWLCKFTTSNILK